MDFNKNPVLIFWETTKACLLACVHCRANAIRESLPGELTYNEGKKLIDDVLSFEKPYPTIIFTGGDPLMREDILDLMNYASGNGIRFGISPSVTELLSTHKLRRIKELNPSSISFSLDGASHFTHDSIRRVPGTFERTIEAIKEALAIGLNVQVNTVVMKSNLHELSKIFLLIDELGVKVWEFFFLVKTGRATTVEDLTPEEYETVCNFLFDASRYGIIIRCVEAPFVRRVMIQRKEQGDYWKDGLYLAMKNELLMAKGEPFAESTIAPRGTLDGDGIIFVSYDGNVYPGGLLPVRLGNIREESLVNIYRSNELLRKIRARELRGYCGTCKFRFICGGSRARAYAYFGEPLATDPACIYQYGQV